MTSDGFHYERPPRPKLHFTKLAKPVLVVVLAVGAVLGAKHFSAPKTISAQRPAETGQVKAAATYAHPESVCVDAGHGGVDPGALAGKYNESAINLIVAQRVSQLLEAKGYHTYQSRTSNDQTKRNKDRYGFCNEKKATILVAIHHNFYSDASVDYATSLYFKESDKALAQAIVEASAAKLQLRSTAISSFEGGVLSKSTMPAVINEAFFMTNSAELKAMAAGPQRLEDEAQGIVDGVVNYFTKPATTGTSEPDSTPANTGSPSGHDDDL